ncbi:MAG: sensor histidine kinase, partial [Selenomonadaceae bacterium]|nr:sensor histidine kinase [Selenomonadaceae bacterium]
RLLNEKLEEANQRLRAYAIEVEQMAETRERNRLAREIHDTLGHSLTGIAAGIDACIITIDAAPEFTKQQLNKIRETARKGITDVRRSVKKLRPNDLERLPFQEALMQMTKDYSESSGMEITFDIFSWSNNLRQDQEDVIYRVLQESITNANRHGHATKVKITIGGNEKYLLIVISDNGIGCDNVKQGFGLRHMRERLELLHGTIHYWSDEGFIIEAMIPLNQEAQNDKNIDC